MIEIIKELKIEVSKPNIFQAVVAKQYDMNTRFIKATLVDGSDVIYIPNDPDRSVKVVINAERPDGQSKGFDGEVNDDGTVTVPLHSWMLELEGTVICDISVIDTEADDNKKLTTTSFTLLVERAAYGGSDVTSDPQYDVLVSLLETCQEASAVAQEALDKSNEALANSEEANSKYDACVEATENANAVRKEIEEGGYVESLKEMHNGGKFSFWVGSQEEYDSIEEITPNCLYVIDDDTTPEDIAKAIEDIDNRLQPLEQDYIVEQGEKDGWNYRKWASGIAECWGRKKSTTISSWDSEYCSISGSFPITFAAHPTFNCSVLQVGCLRSYLTTASATEDRFEVYMKCETPPTNEQSCWFNFSVKGRWK